MRTLEESRKYEVLMPDGSWQPVHWEQLDKGDVVRVNPPLPDDIYHDGAPFVVVELPALKADPLPEDKHETLQS